MTLNAIMQYVWHKVLSVYSQSSQTVVGTTVSGRALPINNIEHAVGLFINTLPVIVNHHRNNENTKPKDTRSIIQVIKNIQDDINEVNNRSNIDLSKLQKEGQRLFDSLFVYENYPSPVNEEQQNRLRVKFIEGIEKLDYPLGVIAYDTSNTLTFKLKYASEIFDADIIQNIPLLIEKLLKQITINPDQQEAALSYLDEKQYQLVVYEWNATEKEYPRDKTIHQLFEEQVERTPDNIAVVYEETKLTYRELNEKANKLAHYLSQNYEIKPDTLIALCLDRSEHMLISILAVLKSGGAYVPMDPSYPNERIEYILGDTRTTVVVTNEIYEPRLKGLIRGEEEETGIVAIDSSQIQEQLLSQLSNNPEQIACNTNLAYIIYTSGTTGNPKGVMIEHRGVVNLAIMQGKEFELTDVTKIKNCLWYSNYVFDAHVWEVYTTLLNGHKLYVINEGCRQDVLSLSNYVRDNAIDIATILFY